MRKAFLNLRHHIWRQVIDQVSDLVGIERFNRVDEFVAVHRFDQGLTNALVDFEQNIAVRLTLDLIPDSKTVVKRQGFEYPSNVGRMEGLQNVTQLLRGFPYFSDTFMPFVIVGICIAVVVLLINSTYGRAFKAIRDDEIAAEAMGINLAHHKRMAFIISSFFAGISGALLAMYQTTVQANTFKSAMTYEILLIVVIGGIGSISGSCIGSFLFIACSEWWLRFLDNETTIETTIGAFKVPLLRTGFRMVVFSVVIMIVVLFFRRGIMGDREISLAGLAKRLTRRSVKGGKEA